ncbi:MAG: transcriptional regulator [Pseudomonadota bacterium]
MGPRLREDDVVVCVMWWCTSHWMLRAAVAQYLEREEKREAFRKDTLKAWGEHRTTGLHVTATEADAWLAQLEDGNDIEPPECHV